MWIRTTMDKIRIRAARVQDAGALLKIYTPYVEKTAITFEYDVPSLKEFIERMERVLAKYPYLAAEADGEIVGYAYAGKFKDRAAYDWAVETSVYVREECRGKGVGRMLYEKLEEALLWQGITNLNACIAYPVREDEYLSLDSVRFHEKMGYQMAGRFHACGYKYERWYDMVWMEKLIGPHEKRQPAIREFRGCPIFGEESEICGQS